MVREPQLYEIGLLIKPELSETEASAELGNVRLEIEKQNGILERTTDPKPRKLAYPIKKISQAYFAALQFSVSPARIATIEKTISTHTNILRSLVLSWTRVPVQRVLEKPMRTRTSETPALYSPVQTKEPAEKFDEKELDKKLDEILGQ
ncbi:MAG: 30S ribosomal protein S6 [Candidatus Ryanbacteria bacterium RIFCSPHIGHO2_02_FULL_45_17b]|uniref:Small ribosomal subunit protein bS6 n=1 Tax=Candidatus Ryanbacteria bacterium RIFCSPHIGHO2_01_FULL_45_22 TaxID=1802114 RepID=A0A1G2G3S3_9BACT|nr:MAG: 30S ribosomal protein S6 [Candidatus Ryanbacteria bacterium RIFCSPHIGHO2_01_FULL_45_22]OGZ47635.1 MAG: 30S ribosomal protein S6 [Candidatus Ryanbacteria bacterium RIFCSPHIGHO2_02_FULL_45_17b]